MKVSNINVVRRVAPSDKLLGLVLPNLCHDARFWRLRVWVWRGRNANVR